MTRNVDGYEYPKFYQNSNPNETDLPDAKWM